MDLVPSEEDKEMRTKEITGAQAEEITGTEMTIKSTEGSRKTESKEKTEPTKEMTLKSQTSIWMGNL